MASILLPFGSSSSVSLGLSCSPSDTEAICHLGVPRLSLGLLESSDITALLTLIGDFVVWEGRSYLRLCRLFPLGGFSCSSSFYCQLNSMSLSPTTFSLFWKIIVTKKANFL